MTLKLKSDLFSKLKLEFFFQVLGKDSKNGGLKTAGRKIQNNNVTKDNDLFTDDTDIFANLPATKQKEKKTVTTTKSASKPLFQEDIGKLVSHI